MKEDKHQRAQARLNKSSQNKTALLMLEAGETGNQQGKVLENNAEEKSKALKRADGETPIYLSRMWQKKTVTFQKQVDQIAEFDDKKAAEAKSSDSCIDNIKIRAAKRQSLKMKNKQNNKMNAEDNGKFFFWQDYFSYLNKSFNKSEIIQLQKLTLKT